MCKNKGGRQERFQYVPARMYQKLVKPTFIQCENVRVCGDLKLLKATLVLTSDCIHMINSHVRECEQLYAWYEFKFQYPARNCCRGVIMGDEDVTVNTLMLHGLRPRTMLRGVVWIRFFYPGATI